MHTTIRHRRSISGLAALALLGTLAVAAPALGGTVGASWGSYSVEVRGSYGARLPTFHHRGRTYVMGKLGQRYEIIVRNHSHRRVEAVVSVDGRDAIDGQRADWTKRGYIVPPRGSVRIDGFRTSLRHVAAFRFSRVSDSYAARMGDPRHVGVVGVAIFPERQRYRRHWRPYWYGAKRKPRYGDPRPTDRDEAEAPSSAPRAESRGDASRGAAGKSSRRSRRPQLDRPGLGTEYGERRHSPVDEVSFTRQNKRHPQTILSLRYNDRRGLQRLGINVHPERPWWQRDLHQRETARPFANRFAPPPPPRPARWRH